MTFLSLFRFCFPFPHSNYLHQKVFGKETCFYPTLVLSSTTWPGQGLKPPLQMSVSHQNSLQKLHAKGCAQQRSWVSAEEQGSSPRGFFMGHSLKHQSCSLSLPCRVEVFGLPPLILTCRKGQLSKIHSRRKSSPNPYPVPLECGSLLVRGWLKGCLNPQGSLCQASGEWGCVRTIQIEYYSG